MGALVIVFAIAPVFWAALAVMFLLGGSMAAFQSLNSSLVLSIADMEYHGRVQSLIMLSFSAFGLAALPFGILADAIGLRETMAATGVACLLASAGSAVWRRRIEQPTVPVL